MSLLDLRLGVLSRYLLYLVLVLKLLLDLGPLVVCDPFWIVLLFLIPLDQVVEVRRIEVESLSLCDESLTFRSATTTFGTDIFLDRD